MGRGVRIFFVSIVGAAACADTSNLSGGGNELPTEDASTPKRDSGSTPIDPDGGGPITTTRRCDPLKPFSPPALVTELDPEASNTKSAVLTPDELEIFYLRYVSSGAWELRHGRRASKDAAWSGIVTDAITPSPQGFLSITAAGKKLYFWTVGQNYRAGRSTTADEFGSPAKYTSPDAPFSFVVDSDDTVYFAKIFSVDSGAGGTERYIHSAPLDSSGHGLGKAVANVHLDGHDDNRPVLNASETVMYFGSNRPRGPGQNSVVDDIWVARRTSKQDDFGPGTYVRELATDDPDYVSWVSDDDCIVMLDRASHIYMAKRPL